MEFVDLVDRQPEIEGKYQVRVISFPNSKVAMAKWTHKTGFTLIDGFLKPEEYIESWKNL